MGIASIVWYVGLTLVSENILYDSIAALGLMIAFYYGLHRLRVRDLLPQGAVQERQELLLHRRLPGGRRAAARSACSSRAHRIWRARPTPQSGESWLGVGPPLMIVAVFFAIGFIYMTYFAVKNPEFFTRKTEVADPAVLSGEKKAVASFAAEED